MENTNFDVNAPVKKSNKGAALVALIAAAVAFVMLFVPIINEMFVSMSAFDYGKMAGEFMEYSDDAAITALGFIAFLFTGALSLLLALIHAFKSSKGLGVACGIFSIIATFAGFIFVADLLETAALAIILPLGYLVCAVASFIAK